MGHVKDLLARFWSKSAVRVSHSKIVARPSVPSELLARPTQDDVILAYRLILGRDPESQSAIEGHLYHESVSALRKTILNSEEFHGIYRGLHPDVASHPNVYRHRRATAFIHLQKTGGTSLRELLAQQFPLERRCPIYDDKLHIFSLAELARYDFFAGHFDISSLRFIPRDEILTLAMFREPLARLISFYRFLKAHPSGNEFIGNHLIPLAHTHTAEEFFELPQIRESYTVNNHYLFAFGRSFSWFDQNYRSLDRSSLTAAVLDAQTNIRALSAIGLTERFKDSVDLICSVLDMPKPAQIYKLHATDNFPLEDSRFQKVSRVQVTPRLISATKDLVEYDNPIYECAVGEFKRRIENKSAA